MHDHEVPQPPWQQAAIRRRQLEIAQRGLAPYVFPAGVASAKEEEGRERPRRRHLPPAVPPALAPPNVCATGLADYHRSCPACGQFDLCLQCCDEARSGELPGGLASASRDQDEARRAAEWVQRCSASGALTCPSGVCGGCGDHRTLQIVSICGQDWLASLLEKLSVALDGGGHAHAHERRLAPPGRSPAETLDSGGHGRGHKLQLSPPEEALRGRPPKTGVSRGRGRGRGGGRPRVRATEKEEMTKHQKEVEVDVEGEGARETDAAGRAEGRGWGENEQQQQQQLGEHGGRALPGEVAADDVAGGGSAGDRAGPGGRAMQCQVAEAAAAVEPRKPDPFCFEDADGDHSKCCSVPPEAALPAGGAANERAERAERAECAKHTERANYMKSAKCASAGPLPEAHAINNDAVADTPDNSNRALEPARCPRAGGPGAGTAAADGLAGRQEKLPAQRHGAGAGDDLAALFGAAALLAGEHSLLLTALRTDSHGRSHGHSPDHSDSHSHGGSHSHSHSHDGGHSHGRDALGGSFLFSPTAEELRTPAGLAHFQRHVARGEPLVVRGSLRGPTAAQGDGLSWEPRVMWRAFRETTPGAAIAEKKTVALTHCFDWTEVNILMHDHEVPQPPWQQAAIRRRQLEIAQRGLAPYVFPAGVASAKEEEGRERPRRRHLPPAVPPALAPPAGGSAGDRAGPGGRAMQCQVAEAAAAVEPRKPDPFCFEDADGDHSKCCSVPPEAALPAGGAANERAERAERAECAKHTERANYMKSAKCASAGPLPEAHAINNDAVADTPDNSNRALEPARCPRAGGPGAGTAAADGLAGRQEKLPAQRHGAGAGDDLAALFGAAALLAGEHSLLLTALRTDSHGRSHGHSPDHSDSHSHGGSHSHSHSHDGGHSHGRDALGGSFLFSPTAEELRTPAGLAHFQRHVARGEPLVVRGSLRGPTAAQGDGLSWEPRVMWRAFRETTPGAAIAEKKTVALTHCFDWTEVNILMHDHEVPQPPWQQAAIRRRQLEIAQRGLAPYVFPAGVASAKEEEGRERPRRRHLPPAVPPALAPPSAVDHVIHDQSFYLGEEHLWRLKEEYGVRLAGQKLNFTKSKGVEHCNVNILMHDHEVPQPPWQQAAIRRRQLEIAQRGLAPYVFPAGVASAKEEEGRERPRRRHLPPAVPPALAPPSAVDHVIHDQSFYLGEEHLWRLKEEYAVHRSRDDKLEVKKMAIHAAEQTLQFLIEHS
eukprot:jgi/Mesen1/3365/ME000191S02502